MSYEQVVKSIMVTYVWPTGVITGRWWNCGRTLGSCVGPREYTLATPDEVEAVSPGVGASSPSSSSSSSSPPRSSSRDVVPPCEDENSSLLVAWRRPLGGWDPLLDDPRTNTSSSSSSSSAVSCGGTWYAERTARCGRCRRPPGILPSACNDKEQNC